MSTGQHIDPEVTDAAVDAWFAARGIDGGITGPVEREAMKAALDAAEEKRRELAQTDPEGQEYAYRVWSREWTTNLRCSKCRRPEWHVIESDGPKCRICGCKSSLNQVESGTQKCPRNVSPSGGVATPKQEVRRAEG